MHADLSTRRRVLISTYTRYLDADRAWHMALDEMKLWFPATNRPGRSAIGNPGSPIRKLYERRERALLQLEVARFKLDAARQRLAERHKIRRRQQLLLVSYIET